MPTRNRKTKLRTKKRMRGGVRFEQFLIPTDKELFPRPSFLQWTSDKEEKLDKIFFRQTFIKQSLNHLEKKIDKLITHTISKEETDSHSDDSD